MGTNTDPYQPVEGRYRLTRGIVEALAAARNPFSILTKSTLIGRDIDLLCEARERTDVETAFSIGCLDPDVWRATEPHTPSPARRMEMVARLNAAGIPCGVLVAPVLPGISDAPEQIEAVVAAAVEAGAHVGSRRSPCTCAPACATTTSAGWSGRGPSWWSPRGGATPAPTRPSPSATT